MRSLRRALLSTTPRISVVIPSFNSEPFLRAAIDSALDQSCPPYEVVVQDGGSTDGTVATLQSYGDQVIWASAPDDGQSDALNKAIKAAKGDIIAWLNSDDRYVPGAFLKVLDIFSRDDAVDFVHGDFDLIDAAGRTFRRYRSAPYSSGRVFARGCYVWSGATFFRRTLFDQVGLFRPDLHCCMDLEFFLRLGGRARSVYVSEPLGQLRIHGRAKSSTLLSSFLREGHAVRWSFAGNSARLRAHALFIDIRQALYLLTSGLRYSRAWSSVRQTKNL